MKGRLVEPIVGEFPSISTHVALGKRERVRKKGGHSVVKVPSEKKMKDVREIAF